MYHIEDYAFDLPEHLIAQKPMDRRDRSRLMVLDRNNGAIAHHRFYELVDFLNAGDLLVINDTRVVPARLRGRKETGGKVEVLLLDPRGDTAVPESADRPLRFRCLVKSSGRLRPGARLQFGDHVTARVAARQQGEYQLEFSAVADFHNWLQRHGRMPLPPYIRRSEDPIDEPFDRRAYQTVYANRPGAIAAPTAGLHFSRELLQQLAAKSIETATITLHVGHGTFLPVRSEDIRQHPMHSERYFIPEATARAICATQSRGGRIIAVGTTCMRTLEYAARKEGLIQAQSGNCDLFIYPGFRFKMVDALITNFHLPRSTLLMLVSAFAGRRNILAAYGQAVNAGYRFFSYGDAMLLC